MLQRNTCGKQCILLYFQNIDDVDMTQVVEPLVIVEGSIFDPKAIHLAAEGMQLFECSDVTEALVCLMSVYYILNMEYPKVLRKSFTFIQNVYMELNAGNIPVTVVNVHTKLKKAMK